MTLSGDRDMRTPHEACSLPCLVHTALLLRETRFWRGDGYTPTDCGPDLTTIDGHFENVCLTRSHTDKSIKYLGVDVER